MFFEIDKPYLPPLKEIKLLNENNEFSIPSDLWSSILDRYTKKEIIEHFSELIENTPEKDLEKTKGL